MQPIQTGSQGAQTTPTGQQDWREVKAQQLAERHSQDQVAGIPVWGVLLIVLGVVAFLGNFGVGVGWVFGLALGAWFVYLGARHIQQGRPINWWLVGLGLLIGLGATAGGLGFTDEVIFPIVLIVVGIGLLGEFYLSRERQAQ